MRGGKMTDKEKATRLLASKCNRKIDENNIVYFDTEVTGGGFIYWKAAYISALYHVPFAWGGNHLRFENPLK